MMASRLTCAMRGLPSASEITLRVADIANREAHDAETHVRHVAGGNFLHLRGERVAVLVNFLHRHRA